jgi:hypothetical protein
MFGITTALSAVASLVSTIGPAVSAFCTNVLPKIIPMIKTGLEFIAKLAPIVEIVAQVFGVFKPEDKTSDIGDRAIQAAKSDQKITPDKFEKFDEYMDAIRKFELDPKLSEAIAPETKVTAGLAIAGKGLDDKFNVPDGTMGNLWVLAASKPEYFSADRLVSLANKTVDIASLLRYFEGKLGPADAISTEKTLLAAEKFLSPEKDEKTIFAEFDEASKAVQKASAE